VGDGCVAMMQVPNARRRVWLLPVMTVCDRVHEQIMDAGRSTVVKRSFDSLEKSIYTSSYEGKT
jgi:hypothetical protein